MGGGAVQGGLVGGGFIGRLLGFGGREWVAGIPFRGAWRASVAPAQQGGPWLASAMGGPARLAPARHGKDREERDKEDG
jgi:hypothetical protein